MQITDLEMRFLDPEKSFFFAHFDTMNIPGYRIDVSLSVY